VQHVICALKILEQLNSNEMTVLCAISSSVRTVRHRHRIINDNT